MHNQDLFFELLEAGLWKKDAQLSSFGGIDYSAIYNLAEEQSLVGLVTAGLEQVKDVKVPQKWTLQFIGATLQIEQRNLMMNDFVAKLFANLRQKDIYSLLVKGQGIAQCYEKPLWRASGDVDLFLSKDNYHRAKSYLTAIAEKIDDENPKTLHQGLTISSWEVELHGTLRSGLWRRLERVIDEVQGDVFYGGNVRSWMNGNVQIFLPGVNEDVILVFSHILQHFFIGGIGLRQICDWCRLIWTYREKIDENKLRLLLRKAGVVTEWKSFAALAVEYLGMPVESMPLYDNSSLWRSKATRLIDIIMKTGNMGHNRSVDYQTRYNPLVRKVITLGRITSDAYYQFRIFPKDAVKVWWIMVLRGKMHE